MIKTECDFSKIAHTIFSHIDAEAPPWKGGILPLGEPPKNFGTGHAYERINKDQIALRKFLSPWYLTSRQVEILGGKVKPNERGVRLFRYGVHLEEPAEETENDPDSDKFVRRYTVFNACQITGIKFPGVSVPSPQNYGQVIKSAEVIFKRMPDPPKISEGRFSLPGYYARSDRIEMPGREHFRGLPDFYGSLFHELIHAAGHSSRLDRRSVTDQDFRLRDMRVYQFEELVAEFGAAFLSAEAGIVSDNFVNSAAYISGWLDTKPPEDLQKILSAAVCSASKSCRFILGRLKDGC